MWVVLNSWSGDRNLRIFRIILFSDEILTLMKHMANFTLIRCASLFSKWACILISLPHYNFPLFENLTWSAFQLWCFISACSQQSFGANCSSECHCADGADCDHVTGECKQCSERWTGTACQVGMLTNMFLSFGHLNWLKLYDISRNVCCSKRWISTC